MSYKNATETNENASINTLADVTHRSDEKRTRCTIAIRSFGSVFGSDLIGSILCTYSGMLPVPNFSTRRWLRKSSSLDKSDMFIVILGAHSTGPFLPFVLAFDARLAPFLCDLPIELDEALYVPGEEE
jgi:hypothetical protein